MILVTWEEAKGIATRTAQLLRLHQHPLIACFLGCATVVYMAGCVGFFLNGFLRLFFLQLCGEKNNFTLFWVWFCVSPVRCI
jgi:hypothetical protein